MCTPLHRRGFVDVGGWADGVASPLVAGGTGGAEAPTFLPITLCVFDVETLNNGLPVCIATDQDLSGYNSFSGQTLRRPHGSSSCVKLILSIQRNQCQFQREV